MAIGQKISEHEPQTHIGLGPISATAAGEVEEVTDLKAIYEVEVSSIHDSLTVKDEGK